MPTSLCLELCCHVAQCNLYHCFHHADYAFVALHGCLCLSRANTCCCHVHTHFIVSCACVFVRAATGTGYASTDYLLYVTSTIAKDCPPIAYAWAQSCDYDIITLRPLVGAINICPLSLVGGEPVETTVATLVHEIIHALVRGLGQSVCSGKLGSGMWSVQLSAGWHGISHYHILLCM